MGECFGGKVSDVLSTSGVFLPLLVRGSHFVVVNFSLLCCLQRQVELTDATYERLLGDINVRINDVVGAWGKYLFN